MIKQREKEMFEADKKREEKYKKESMNIDPNDIVDNKTIKKNKRTT